MLINHRPFYVGIEIKNGPGNDFFSSTTIHIPIGQYWIRTSDLSDVNRTL
jgi:hypothetical protein